MEVVLAGEDNQLLVQLVVVHAHHAPLGLVHVLLALAGGLVSDALLLRGGRALRGVVSTAEDLKHCGWRSTAARVLRNNDVAVHPTRERSNHRLRLHTPALRLDVCTTTRCLKVKRY